MVISRPRSGLPLMVLNSNATMLNSMTSDDFCLFLSPSSSAAPQGHCCEVLSRVAYVISVKISVIFKVRKSLIFLAPVSIDQLTLSGLNFIHSNIRTNNKPRRIVPNIVQNKRFDHSFPCARHTTVRSLLSQKCPVCFSICHLQTPHSVYSLPQSRRLYTGKGNPPCPAKTYETLFITTSIPLSPTSYCRICTRPTLNCTKWTFVSPVLTLFRLHCIIKSTCQMTSAF